MLLEKKMSPGSGETPERLGDRKSTRLNSSHGYISYAVFCLKKNKILDAFGQTEGPGWMSSAQVDILALEPTYGVDVLRYSDGQPEWRLYLDRLGSVNTFYR